MNLSHYSKQIPLAPFSASFRAASLAGSPLKTLMPPRGSATIPLMVAGYLSMSREAAQKSAKKCIKNHLYLKERGMYG